MPELSVLLPARNAEATIGRAVSSTLRAMPRDAELVVLDDGSTDGTLRVLERLGTDARLRVLHAGSDGGRGVGFALERLRLETDSRYIARMDADDISLPWRFSATTPMLRSADLVFATIVKLHGRRPALGLPLPISTEAFGFHLLLTNPACHPTLIASREILERVGGYRQVPSEDYDLWLRCASDGGRLARVGTHALVYRVHPGQVTASAAWLSASWTDDRQAQAFADLSERLVGKRLRRLVHIAASAREGELDRELGEFEAAMAPAIGGINGVQGRFLRQRLQARLRWARQRGMESQK